MNDTVEKSIFFGVLDWKYKNKNVDIPSIFKKIENLSFEDGSRYFTNNEGQRFGIILKDKITDGIESIYGCIGDSRTTDLPFLERKGVVMPLEIEKGCGIFDAMHFLIRKNSKGNWIIVYEFNIYAPRIFSICSYLRNKFESDIDFAGINTVSGDSVTKIMKKFKAIKKIRMAIYPGADVTELSPVLNQALKEISDEQNGGLIELSFSVRYKREIGLNGNIVNNIVPFFKTTNPQISMEHFYVQGINNQTGEKEIVNLMDIVLKVKRRVEKQKNDYRFIDSDKMYAALDEAYKQYKVKLDKL